MKMTQLQGVKETIKMWLWIYKYPEKHKDDYLKKIKYRKRLPGKCFLCFVFNFSCWVCPLGSAHLFCKYYVEWARAENIKDSKKAAMKIVNACRKRIIKQKKKK